MKKIILWVLLAALLIGAVIGVAVSCNNNNQQTEPTTEATIAGDPTGVNDVIAYLKSQYKDEGAMTPVDYKRFGIVRIAGVPYEVVWTADVSEEFIKVVVNDDGTVTIDVNEECEADTPYVLATSTVTPLLIAGTMSCPRQLIWLLSLRKHTHWLPVRACLMRAPCVVRSLPLRHLTA